jgi:glycosyltransferase involved in cell wall biosynthesis
LRRTRVSHPELDVSLVVSHDPVDADPSEIERLESEAVRVGVPLVFAHAALTSLDPPADIFELYRASDVALYPSDFEGFGNALLEVLAFGLPTIVNEYEVYREDIGPIGFEVETVQIPETFRFSDFLSEGLAAFSRHDVLGLDRAADRVVEVLAARDGPGAALSHEEQARSERNRERLRENYAYGVVEAKLSRIIERLL